MKTRYQRMIATTLAFAGLVGACATAAPPSQLVEARAAYRGSNSGLAARLSPTELYGGKNVLDQANREFDEHGDTNKCRDYAYIAQRKFELADVNARTELDRRKIAEATAQGQELAKTTAQLDAEKQARLSAEGKLADAMKDLATIAAVREESRGMVITLSGSVLFASGEYALLYTATTKLDQVAEALKAQNAEKRMLVEAHTDSHGSAKVNQPLSMSRGIAVRDYLVSQGVDAQKITAAGLGSTRPIVDNKTAENRASNRRVEIVISAADPI